MAVASLSLIHPDKFSRPNYALVFDVETTGLLPRGTITSSGLITPDGMVIPFDKLPYINQFSFVIYNVTSKRIMRTYNQYIRLPVGVKIPSEVTKITGITDEKCIECGVDIVEALAHFNGAYRFSNILVAHNFDFDHRMLQLECARNASSVTRRWGYDPRFFDLAEELKRGMTRYCTMQEGTKLCNIMVPGRRTPKWPTLSELHQTLFGVIPENLHDSLVDVLATLKCYKQMTI